MRNEKSNGFCTQIQMFSADHMRSNSNVWVKSGEEFQLLPAAIITFIYYYIWFSLYITKPDDLLTKVKKLITGKQGL